MALLRWNGKKWERANPPKSAVKTLVDMVFDTIQTLIVLIFILTLLLLGSLLTLLIIWC